MTESSSFSSSSSTTSNVAMRPHPFHSQNFRYLRLSVPITNPDVLIVSLNRPNKRNAINSYMWKEIGQVFHEIATSNSETWHCRCVLLMGEGTSFSSGIDITDSSFFIPQTNNNNDMKDDVAHIGLTFLPKLIEMQNAFSALEHCPVPIIVAIHGTCIGAGIDLICATDIRLCEINTIFSVREVAMGLTADVGTLQRLPKITSNQSLVHEVCLTGRNFTTSEAVDMGLISCGNIFDNKEQLVTEALKLCTTIARHSPVAIRGTKKALLYARDHSVQDGLNQVAAYNALALQSQDLVKAFMAKASGQEPTFANIPPHSRL